MNTSKSHVGSRLSGTGFFKSRISVFAGVFSTLLVGSACADIAGDFQYTRLGKIAVVTGYVGLDPHMVVPATLNGLPVKEIGKQAFMAASQITAVTLPEGLEVVQDYAFGNCPNLVAVNLPRTLTTVGTGAFISTGVPEWVIPGSVTRIGDYSFASSKASRITMGSGVREIGSGAFYFSLNLTLVSFPNSVKGIGSMAFYGCKNLSAISLSDSLVSLESGAFKDCSSLTEVTFPKTVKLIEKDAFSGCSNLSSAVFLGNAPEVEVAALPFGMPIGLASSFKVSYYLDKKGFGKVGSRWLGYKTALVPAKGKLGSSAVLGTNHGLSVLNLGALPVGGDRDRTFFLKNIGGNILTIKNFSVYGNDRYPHHRDFSVVASKKSELSLRPGEQTSFVVTFSPTNVNSRWAYVRIETNDRENRYFYMVVSGTGAKK
jgi:BspA type Leucine rich repeat region (6 copies)